MKQFDSKIQVDVFHLSHLHPRNSSLTNFIDIALIDDIAYSQLQVIKAIRQFFNDFPLVF